MFNPTMHAGDRNLLAKAGSGPQLNVRTHALIHFNNAGCSVPAPGVVDAVQAYVDAEVRYGGYEVAEMPEFEQLLHRPYTELAALLGCEESSIGIVSSATAAWQRIFLGLPLWLPGSRIYTSVAEYGSNFLAYLQVRQRYGTEICVVRELESGALDLQHLQELLRGRRRDACNVVSVSHIPTSSGRVYDAEALGAVLRLSPDVLYLLDACQSVGQMPVDVGSIGCHFLTGTGRKYLRSPRGSGFLYVSPEILQGSAAELPARVEPAALDVRGGVWLAPEEYCMHDTARRYEEYEMSFAAKVGLGVGCAYAGQQGVRETWARIQALADHLRTRLRGVPGATVHDRGGLLCGIVSFSLAGWPPHALKAALRAAGDPAVFAERCGAEWPAGAGFNVSVSAAPSTRLDFEQRGLTAVVRASVHAHNSTEEVEIFVRLVGLLASVTSRAANFTA